MVDCGNSVRTLYLSALNGNLSYNSVNVPVYGQTPFNTPPKNYVIISDISETANNTNHNFQNVVNVNIDIYSEQYRTNDLSIVDNIASQILNLLIPDTNVNGISDASFVVYPMSRTASRYLPLYNGDNFIARKIITITNLVNQK